MDKLPVETVASIEDVVNNFVVFTNPFKELKQCLCWAYGCTEQQKVNDLLDLPPLGTEKPSIPMDNILSLWPHTTKLLLGMFLCRQMRAQLAKYQADSLGRLATAADAIWAQQSWADANLFRDFASPTRKHFDDVKREDAPPLKTTRSRKERRVTDAKFCVTGVSDIR